MSKNIILVVDDAPENIDMLVGLLKDDFTVKAAKSGEVGLKIAQLENAPNLVLLDVNMPGMDGFELCQKLKDNPLTASIPVIFLSGEVGEEERRRGRELGAVDYLTKPVDPKKLFAAIASALSA